MKDRFYLIKPGCRRLFLTAATIVFTVTPATNSSASADNATTGNAKSATFVPAVKPATRYCRDLPAAEIRTQAPADVKDGARSTETSKKLLDQWDTDSLKISAPQGAAAKQSVQARRMQTMSALDQSKLLTLDRQATDLRLLAEQINRLRKIITDNPEDPSLRFKLGCYLFRMGDLEGAANELKTCIAVQPTNPYARTELARVLESGGDRNQALEQYRKSLELGPSVAETHFYIAECLVHSGYISEAIREYRKAIDLKPEGDAYSGLSEALLAANDNQGAMKAARQAVAVDSSSARAQVALTNALLKSGDDQASVRTARQAALLNPSLPASHLALGRCLFTKGDTAAAVEEFKQAVSLDPLNSEARNDLGYALYRTGDISSAITEFRLALRLNPHFIEARNNLEVAINSFYADKH